MYKALCLFFLLALASFVTCEPKCGCIVHEVKERRPVKPAEVSSEHGVSEASESANGMSEEDYRKQLGRATWRLLHTMAARYPDEPDELMKRRTRNFMNLLSYLYPCARCSVHMREMFAEFPPKVDSQEEFSQWMCDIHNMVNVRLGKEEFPCHNVDMHYDCGCDLHTYETPTSRPTKPIIPKGFAI